MNDLFTRSGNSTRTIKEAINNTETLLELREWALRLKQGYEADGDVGVINIDDLIRKIDGMNKT